MGYISANGKYSELYYSDLERTCGIISEDIRGKSILITGASGLIGSYMTDALVYCNRSRGTNVHITAMSRNIDKLKSRFSYLCPEDNVMLCGGDVCCALPECENAFDFIIHAASNADPRTYALYPTETILTNVQGVFRCLDYARSHAGTRVVLTSTMEVYGEMKSSAPINEDDFGTVNMNLLRSGYPESKRVAELLCKSYWQQYSVNACIARLGYIYGPTMTATDSKVVAQFIRKAMAKEDIVLKSAGRQIRSYCYVADAVDGIFTLLLRGASGEAYNISDRDSVTSIADMAQTAADIAGSRVVFDIPEELEAKGYSPSNDAVLSAEKLRALGWEPYTPLRDGFIKTIQILQENN